MKCRERYCQQEAMPGDPRCGFHQEAFDEKTASAAKDLKKPLPNPTPRTP